MPCFAADLFLNWLMLVETLGDEPVRSQDSLAEENTAIIALEMPSQLAAYMPEDIYAWNPIHIAERMTRSDDHAYCALLSERSICKWVCPLWEA